MNKKDNPDSKFIKVKCPKCNNQQVIFNKTATEIRCLVCDELLARPTGGFSEIVGEELEVLE